jgi:hypothetical protein
VTADQLGGDFRTARLTYRTHEGTWEDPDHAFPVVEKPRGETVVRWYLSKIRSYDGEEIAIEYNTIEDVQHTRPAYIGTVQKYASLLDSPTTRGCHCRHPPLVGCVFPNVW